MVTDPAALGVAVAAGDARPVFQELSRGGSPTSIGEGCSGATCGPVRMRMRTVRGETNWMENGSAGLTAYSPSGNVTPSNGRSTFSMLLKAMRG